MQLLCIITRLKLGRLDVETGATEETSWSDSRETDWHAGGAALAPGARGRLSDAVERVARPGRAGRGQATWIVCSAACERRFSPRTVESRYCRRRVGNRQVLARPRFRGGRRD